MGEPHGLTDLLQEGQKNGHILKVYRDIVTVTVVCTVCDCMHDIEGVVGCFSWFFIPCVGISSSEWSDAMRSSQDKLLEEDGKRREDEYIAMHPETFEVFIN